MRTLQARASIPFAPLSNGSTNAGEGFWTDFTVNATPNSSTDINLDNINSPSNTSSANRMLNTLTLAGATSLNVTGIGSNALSIKSGILSSDTNHTISVPFLRIGDGTVATNLPVTVVSNTLTISSVITDNGGFAGAISKGGAGTLLLSGANTFTGGLSVFSGTVQAGAATTAFGINGPLFIANDPTAVLALNGFDETVGLAGGRWRSPVGGTVNLGGNTAHRAGGNNANTLYAGTIVAEAGGSLTKTGSEHHARDQHRQHLQRTDDD